MFGRARIKLAFWYAGALALTLTVVGGAAFVALRRSLDDEINSSIQRAAAGLRTPDLARAAGLPAMVADDRRGKDLRGDDDERDDHGGDDEHAPSVDSDVFFVVTSASGAILSNPRQVDLEGLDFAALAGDSGGQTVIQDVQAHDHHYRIQTETFTTSDSSTYLHIARSLDPRDRQLRTLTMVLVIGGIAGVVVSGAGGWWLAGRTLVPIRKTLDTQRRFVSDASHELRTPIATIMANNELLLRHADSSIEANLDQVEAVAAEAEHMSHLVDDLLTLARADEGRAAIDVEAVELGGLAEEVGRDMAALAEVRHVRFAVETHHVAVDGDRQRLRQLTVILLDNALKYTPAGGSVGLRVRRSGKRAELSVHDTGPGIPPEHQRRIFDRFFRIDASRSRSAGGTGLGLAIAQWIAEAHHGRIAVESTPGQGSTFTVRLPARD